ncbi:Zeta toxin domain-containing protein [Plasmodiophora brassicae]
MPASAASLGLDLAVVRRRAISTWRTRLLLLCAVQIACTMVAFASGYWFMMFTMFVGLLAGIYGSLFSKHEFVFVHLALLLLSELTNISLLALILLDYPVGSITSSPLSIQLLIVFLAVEIVFALPATFYCAFYLHQSLRAAVVSLTFGPVNVGQSSAAVSLPTGDEPYYYPLPGTETAAPGGLTRTRDAGDVVMAAEHQDQQAAAAGGGNVDVSVIGPEETEEDSWRYFDLDLETRIRRFVANSNRDISAELLKMSPRQWARLKRALIAFTLRIRRPMATARFPDDPRMMVLTCGFPGSGKSFFAEAVVAAPPEGRFVRINQDILGSRKKCVAATRRALTAGQSVIIDRTNITQQHRAVFLEIAREMNVGFCAVITFDVPPIVCRARILSRNFHPTLKAEPASIDILRRFVNEFERPSLEEGFHQAIRIVETADADRLVRAVLERVSPNPIPWETNT